MLTYSDLIKICITKNVLIFYFSPLLKAKAGFNTFWKKPCVIFLIIILVIAIFIVATCVYLIGSKNNLPNSSSVAPWSIEHKSRPTLRIRSVATTNGNYFQKCSPAVTCDPDAKYRTYNGSCNNLQNPNWGSALTPYYRLINAEFGDGK